MPDQPAPRSTGTAGGRYVVVVVLLAGLASVPAVIVHAAGQAVLDRSTPAPVVGDHQPPSVPGDVTVVVPSEPRAGAPAVPVSHLDPSTPSPYP